jgi:hypothetical protein
MYDQTHNAAGMRGVDAHENGKSVTCLGGLHPTTQTSDSHPCARLPHGTVRRTGQARVGLYDQVVINGYVT